LTEVGFARIANAVAVLASPDADWITAQVPTANGGSSKLAITPVR
jgi:hypothetical protein